MDPATRRTYWYHSQTLETTWEEPPPAFAPAAPTAEPESATDWITATVLGATGGDSAAAANATKATKAARAPLCATVNLIHGPPGTGKTSELARLVVNESCRVLCCAPSNRAAPDGAADERKRASPSLQRASAAPSREIRPIKHRGASARDRESQPCASSLSPRGKRR